MLCFFIYQLRITYTSDKTSSLKVPHLFSIIDNFIFFSYINISETPDDLSQGSPMRKRGRPRKTEDSGKKQSELF